MLVVKNPSQMIKLQRMADGYVILDMPQRMRLRMLTTSSSVVCIEVGIVDAMVVAGCG